MTFEAIIWYLVLLDSLFANLGSYKFPKWYKKNYKGLSKYLPLTKAWTAIYLILVLWIGYALYRLDILPY